MKIFADTYALIEILNGNPAYQKYTHYKIVTTMYQLFELFYDLIKQFPEDTATDIFYQYRFCEMPLKMFWVFEAAKFKQQQQGKNMSYTDCLGYKVAEDLGLKFLTGDKAFKGMQNVEFVR